MRFLNWEEYKTGESYSSIQTQLQVRYCGCVLRRNNNGFKQGHAQVRFFPEFGKFCGSTEGLKMSSLGEVMNRCCIEI